MYIFSAWAPRDYTCALPATERTLKCSCCFSVLRCDAIWRYRTATGECNTRVWVGGWCVPQECGLICGYCVWRVACCWTNRSRLVTSWPPTTGWLDLTSGLAFQSCCFRAGCLLVHSSVMWTVGWSSYCTASLQLKALTILSPVFKCFCPNKDASSVYMCRTEAIEFLCFHIHIMQSLCLFAPSRNWKGIISWLLFETPEQKPLIHIPKERMFLSKDK